MALLQFYVVLFSTGGAALIALYAFLRSFMSYRDRLTPSLLYLSIFFLFFSINYFFMLFRLISGRNILFYSISNIFGPIALVFLTVFAFSLVWPGRERIASIFSSVLFLIYFISSLYIEPEVVYVYEGVSEVVYPYHFVVLTLFAISSLSFFVATVFLVYARRVRWSALRKGGVMIASGSLILAVFVYLFEWPGFLGSLLPLTRAMAAVAVYLIYYGTRTLQSAKLPSF
jgi:hypothetical protein